MTSTPVRPTDTTDATDAAGSTDATDSGLAASLLPTLGGDSYVDPQIFDAECERIFERSWYCAVHESDLPRPGSFHTVQVGRESVLLTRNRAGDVKAHVNVCRHRGARLCLEESGQVKRLQCPYHAWTYDLDGQLIAAPNLNGMPDIDRAEFGLHQVAVRRWLGYVWVCLDREPPSFEETVEADVVERLAEMSNLDAYTVPTLQIGKRIRYEVAANWKLIIENFMECYHCATIHPELTEVLPEFTRGFAAQYSVNHGAEFGDEIEGFTVDGSAGFEALPELLPDQQRKYYAITIRPQVFVNLTPDHVIVHRMFPLAADRTIVECDWLYHPDVVASGRDVSHSVELFHRVNQQDFEACERTQPAMNSRFYREGGVLTPTEHHIAQFHDWVTQRLAEPASN